MCIRDRYNISAFPDEKGAIYVKEKPL